MNNEKAFARQWFDYINQIECNVYFSPFFTCRIPKHLRIKHNDGDDDYNVISPQVMDDDYSTERNKQNANIRNSHDVDNLNETYSQNGVSYKTEDEFKIDTNPRKKSNLLLNKNSEQKQSSYNNKPTWLPLDDDGFS